MDKLFIVMPAYNEEENIVSVVEQWYKKIGANGHNTESKLVVADCGSTDSTHSILLSLKEKYPKLEILENDNQYHGPKVIALYDYAIRNGADYIFQTDSDGQTDPDEFDEFWDVRDKYDAIIGNRTVRGDGKDRAFVEKVVCFLLKLYFGVNIPDANAPFRLMKTSVLKEYLYRLPRDYNIPNIMLTTYLAYYNRSVLFKEISFKSRMAGANSINFNKIIKIGIEALGDFRKFKKDMKST